MPALTIPALPPIPDAASPFGPEAFAPDEALAEWVKATLVATLADDDTDAPPCGPLVNRDHDHLARADVAFLWTQHATRVRGASVVGRASLGEPQGSDDWLKGMKRDHLTRLFGRVPDFYITLSTGFVLDALRGTHTPDGAPDEFAVLALIDHELYHCAQAHKPGFPGVPAFDSMGRPKWTMRPHDVEQFVGVTRRYGPQGPAEIAMHDAAQRGPTIARASIQGVCGTCGSSFL